MRRKIFLVIISSLLVLTGIEGARAQYRWNEPDTAKVRTAQFVMSDASDAQDRFLRRSVFELQDEARRIREVAGSIQAQTRRMNVPTWQEWWFVPSVAILITGLAMFLIWYNAEQKIRVERNK